MAIQYAVRFLHRFGAARSAASGYLPGIKPRLAQGAAVTGLMLALPFASAAEGPATGESEATGTPSAELGEVVVTATRREESLSKVPISMTALSQDSLDERGIRDITELVRYTPGVSIDTSGTNAIAIRGISSSGGAGTTGIYIDDTPIQMRALGFNPDETLPKTFDLERVEVLRGPQGTLFGSGSEGGTVRYIMTQPKVSGSSTYIRTELSFTQHGEPSYEAGVAHGDTLADGVLGYRASLWYRYDGGWIDRVDATSGATTEKNANRANTVVARLAFAYQPIDGLSIVPSLLYQNKRQHDLGTYWPAYSNPSSGHFANATPELIPIPDQYYLPALRVQYDVGRITLISNTSFYHRNEQDSYQGTAYDLSYYQSQGWLGVNGADPPAPACGAASTTPTPPCSWYPLLDGNGIHLPAGFTNYQSPDYIYNRQRTVTQEVRVQSNDPDSAWKWTVGGFWSLAQEISSDHLIDPYVVPFWTALYGSSPFDYPLLQNASGGASYHCGSIGTPDPGLPECAVYYNRINAHDRQLAGFGEVTYSLTKRLSVTLGARFANLKYDIDDFADGIENGGPSQFSGHYSENAFTPKAGISFQADSNNLFYATYAKGFRPGGVNAPLAEALCGVTPESYKSDTTQSYEIGAKNNIRNRLRLASSIYYVRWNGIQQNVYDPGPTGGCGFQYISNQGTAVAKGFDLQADALIGGGLSLEASVGYTSARYTKSTSTVSSGDALSGSSAINYSPGTTAPWTVVVGPEYRFTLAGRETFVRLDWEYASRNPWLAAVQNPANVTQYNQFSYTLPATSFLSLRSGMTVAGWEISAFVDNLLDSHTVINYALTQVDYNNPNGPPTPQQNTFTWRPRTIGLTALLHLGSRQ